MNEQKKKKIKIVTPIYNLGKKFITIVRTLPKVYENQHLEPRSKTSSDKLQFLEESHELDLNKKLKNIEETHRRG